MRALLISMLVGVLLVCGLAYAWQTHPIQYLAADGVLDLTSVTHDGYFLYSTQNAWVTRYFRSQSADAIPMFLPAGEWFFVDAQTDSLAGVGLSDTLWVHPMSR